MFGLIFTWWWLCSIHHKSTILFLNLQWMVLTYFFTGHTAHLSSSQPVYTPVASASPGSGMIWQLSAWGIQHEISSGSCDRDVRVYPTRGTERGMLIRWIDCGGSDAVDGILGMPWNPSRLIQRKLSHLRMVQHCDGGIGLPLADGSGSRTPESNIQNGSITGARSPSGSPSTHSALMKYVSRSLRAPNFGALMSHWYPLGDSRAHLNK
jgi:hypothetical protein